MTSTRYLPVRWVSQIFLRLANALIDRGVWPAMYSRRTWPSKVGSIFHCAPLRRSSVTLVPLSSSVAALGRVGPPTLRNRAAVVTQTRGARPLLVDTGGQIGLVRLEPGPQRRHLRVERGAQTRERPLPALELLLMRERGGPLLGFLGQARRPRDNSARARVDVHELDAVVGEEKLTDLVGVTHPARLEHVEPAVPLAARLERDQQEPGVDDRGDLDVGLLQLGPSVSETGQERGDPLHLEVIDQPGQRGLNIPLRRHRDQAADGVEHHDAWPKPFDRAVHAREMHLETVHRGASGLELEQATIDPLLEVDPDRSHVADHLLRRFLELERQAAFPPPAGGVDEVRRHARLAGSGGARHEDRAAAEVALATEHR